jgi:hypothetical protein
VKITRFEDIEAWKEARVLVSMVYSLRSTAEVQSQLADGEVHESGETAARVHPLPENNYQTINQKTVDG